MKKSSSLAIAFLTSVIAAQGTDRFQLDFDQSVPAPPDNTQSGWEAFSDTAEANNKSVSYSGYTDLASGDITITTSGVQFTRNYNNADNAAPDFPETDLDRVYNDLILRDTAGTLDITVEGLNAGTYQFTTHHLTQGIESSVPSTFSLSVQDADSPAFGQDVGTFSMGKGNNAPLYFAPTVAVFDVTSNGVDPVIVRITTGTFADGGGQGAWIGINGLVISPPAPPFRLDFNGGAINPTLAGWEAFNSGSGMTVYPGYPDLASGGISIATSGVEFVRDRPGTPPVNDMLRDLILFNDDENLDPSEYTGNLQIAIGGLAAGTYELKTYHMVAPSPNLPFFDHEITDANGTALVGNFQMGNIANGETVVTTTFESNGIDDVIVSLTATLVTNGGESNWIGINGLEISAQVSSAPFQLVIAPNAGNPGNYDFSWNSLAGKEYDLVSATDLDSPPATWTVWDGNADIAATPGTNTLINVPGGGDPKRFFAVVEKDAP